jgi:hypothetical protein
MCILSSPGTGVRLLFVHVLPSLGAIADLKSGLQR